MSAKTKAVDVHFAAEVLQGIRQHARSSMDAEVCGVLIGRVTSGRVQVEVSIRGEHAARGSAHVTFTQETWAHVHRVRDEKHPAKVIVGWYHSHPGLGIFLSERDRFIHQHFFAAPHQLAWVCDPHSDEEGCFGWKNNTLTRVRLFAVLSSTRTRRDSERAERDARVGGAEASGKRSWWCRLRTCFSAGAAPHPTPRFGMRRLRPAGEEALDSGERIRVRGGHAPRGGGGDQAEIR